MINDIKYSLLLTVISEVPMKNECCGVVTLKEIRFVIFLAELNNLRLCAAGIINSYFEAETKDFLHHQ